MIMVEDTGDILTESGCSKVKVTRPDGSKYTQDPTFYEKIPLREKNYRRYAEDLKIWRKQANKEYKKVTIP